MKSGIAWIFFTAARYISGRKRSRSSPSSVLAVLGIATGVLALLARVALQKGSNGSPGAALSGRRVEDALPEDPPR